MTLPDGSTIPPHVNEEELEQAQALRDPVIFENETEFDEEELKKAMRKEKESMDQFEVYEEVPLDDLTQEEQREALTLKWVHTWKGFVKSRLCVRGYKQEINDLDETYASTPVIYMLRILLILSLARGWAIRFFDVSTAFLHATIGLTKPIFVWPPREFYPNGGLVWKLKKAMYGLRSSPRDWQTHLAQVLESLGLKRLQSHANVYVLFEWQVYILAHVDDLMAIGLREHVDRVLSKLFELF